MKTTFSRAALIASITTLISSGVCLSSWAASFKLPGGFDSDRAEQFDTSLYFYSESGDFVGQGREWFYGPTQGDFSVSKNFDNGVDFRFDNDDLVGFWNSVWWTGNFAAPFSEDLVAGTYSGATRFPFQDSNESGLDVSGDGRGCNRLGGNFDVLEVEYDINGGVSSFDAIFAQYCENEAAIGTPALFGRLRFNATNTNTTTSPIPEPSGVLSLVIIGTVAIWKRFKSN